MPFIVPTRRLALALAAGLAVGAAQASNFSKEAYRGAKTDIKARYKVERDACDSAQAAAKGVCVELAKGNQKIALAQLQANYSGSAADEFKLYKAHYEATYSIAREKCNGLKGSDKDICVQQAKTVRDKAEADSKMAKKINAAVEDDARARLKADYKLAREICESMSGDAKDVCVVSAKARYSEGWAEE